MTPRVIAGLNEVLTVEQSVENFSTSESVKEQYNRAPYPQVNWLASCPQTSVMHATYETGAALVNHKAESHRGKKIALLGCGTFEPYALGAWQPQASVDAVDFSPKSLRQAKVRCHLRGVHHVNFYAADLNEFCHQREAFFDYIQCFGVLHHLESPEVGFKSISQALKPDGFARIMVYSKTSRRRPQLLRKAALLLGLQKSPQKIPDFIDALPWNHPLKLSFLMNADNLTSHGIVDSSLHACEYAFSLVELLAALDDADLQVSAWDFSQNILNLLEEEKEKCPVDKILRLEAFDQWPSSFTFWVRKKNNVVSEDAPKIYAAFSPPPVWQRNIPSTVLRRSIKLTSEQRRVWRRCFRSPQVKKTLDEATFQELLDARFLLEVNG